MIANAFELTYEAGFGQHHTRIIYCNSVTDKQQWLDSLSLWISREKNILTKRSPSNYLVVLISRAETDEKAMKRITRIFSKQQITEIEQPTVEESVLPGHQISLPFNFEHKLHIDKDLIWSGQDPLESFDLVETLGEG